MFSSRQLSASVKPRTPTSAARSLGLSCVLCLFLSVRGISTGQLSARVRPGSQASRLGDSALAGSRAGFAESGECGARIAEELANERRDSPPNPPRAIHPRLTQATAPPPDAVPAAPSAWRRQTRSTWGRHAARTPFTQRRRRMDAVCAALPGRSPQSVGFVTPSRQLRLSSRRPCDVTFTPFDPVQKMCCF